VGHVELGDVEVCARQDEFHRYFVLPPGREHFRLLASISSQLPAGSVVADLAPPGGRRLEALALTANPSVRVLTAGGPTFGRANMHVVDPIDLSDVLVVWLGTNTREAVEGLIASGFGGIALVDNIHLDPANRTFWSWASQAYAGVDLTGVGHVVGTGMLVCGPKVVVK
jgi:hypothetical protein